MPAGIPDDDTGGGGAGGGATGGNVVAGGQFLRLRGRFRGDKNSSSSVRLRFTFTPSGIPVGPIELHSTEAEATVVGR